MYFVIALLQENFTYRYLMKVVIKRKVIGRWVGREIMGLTTAVLEVVSRLKLADFTIGKTLPTLLLPGTGTFVGTERCEGVSMS